MEISYKCCKELVEYGLNLFLGKLKVVFVVLFVKCFVVNGVGLWCNNIFWIDKK